MSAERAARLLRALAAAREDMDAMLLRYGREASPTRLRAPDPETTTLSPQTVH